ncbi:YqhR family membrane protein [Desulfallas thermosapovorans]|uniref:Membrane protein YqhR n=1 Tax=Desulfallas thermosapovorans DSM 6562 TaxID=1121431 RepID=A0A5S4ZPH8_9FIRM|nr:YqhR family membrane protein [Desulfallas thermosapovorans]TYO94543.1 membrane protein YqhR [Desulfallas thermosapovorans DSM 6562]
MVIIKDVITRGFIAGLTGGILMNIISYISYYLGIANLRFLDWPSIIITGHSPVNTLSLLFFLAVQLIFVGFLGSVFALLISKLVTSTNYIFKGILFGIISWFTIYGLTYIADVPKLTPLTIGTAITDFTGAVVYGVTMAEILNRLDMRTRLS